MGGLLDELVQHLVRDVLDHVGRELVHEPGEDLLLVRQIPVVQGGDFVLKVHQRRNVVHAVLGRHRVVVNLDEGDSYISK